MSYIIYNGKKTYCSKCAQHIALKAKPQLQLYRLQAIKIRNTDNHD